MILVVLVGTAGFQILEGVDPITSLYWTIATVSTIGYGDVVPHTIWGRIFRMVIIISGVSFALYTFTTVMAFSVGHFARGSRCKSDGWRSKGIFLEDQITINIF